MGRRSYNGGGTLIYIRPRWRHSTKNKNKSSSSKKTQDSLAKTNDKGHSQTTQRDQVASTEGEQRLALMLANNKEYEQNREKERAERASQKALRRKHQEELGLKQAAERRALREQNREVNAIKAEARRQEQAEKMSNIEIVRKRS